MTLDDRDRPASSSTDGTERVYRRGLRFRSAPLHNHRRSSPAALRSPLDLGAVDILRTRECAIPRYNRSGAPRFAGDVISRLGGRQPRLAREIEQF